MDEEPYRSAPDTEAAHARAAALFDRMHARLRAVLPASAIILHIGATAVPGCLTKGDLDIVVRVLPDDFAPAETILAAMFARNPGSALTSDFAAFEDPQADPPLGVQLAAIGGAFDDFHRFSDALRGDPDLVERYNALKRAHENKPMAEYRAAKDTFVANILGRS